MSEEGAEGQLRRRAEMEPMPPRAPITHPIKPALKPSNDAGYWSFMSGSIFILFVAYVAGKGQLKDWLDVLIPNPQAAPKVEGAGEKPSAYGSQLNAPGRAQGTPLQTPKGPIAPWDATFGKGANTPPNTNIVPGGDSILKHFGVYDMIRGFFGGAFQK